MEELETWQSSMVPSSLKQLLSDLDNNSMEFKYLDSPTIQSLFLELEVKHLEEHLEGHRLKFPNQIPKHFLGMVISAFGTSKSI